ncbi:hypothetical protein CCR97_04210 [Rhodoplanes elegans]|uniref:TNase-like domain-containing protein n=1 Tax=Rhodoplanes elegans TaxID=29408 RepID=A0A327KNI3_9BRAD|nr:thermonuclease family protein [Rhodoplanes elegans]MBK5957413.1 hypothetical protein [Rhodoplanes elegans]RAI39536.1 hypothetical protein CH338_09185 [Rhodoplanes elegans]
MKRLALLLVLLAAPAAAGEVVVIDGDTLTLGDAVVRLAGIDAPEMRQTCASASGRPYACGLEARRALVDLVQGRDVTCTITGRDRYGRQLGVCRTSVGELNAAMVRAGWAVDYTRYSHGRWARDEAAARDAKRGLWRGGTFEMPEDWRRSRRGAR